MPRLSAPLLFCVLLAAGCAGPRPRGDAPADLPDAFPHHTEEQIRFHLLRTADTLQAFTARASMVIRSPEQSGQFSADLRSRRNDSLYLTISPGLGIEAARALVTPDSFYLYDRIKNRLVYGALADAGDRLPSPLAQADIFPNLLGLTVPEANVDWTLFADSAAYVLRSPDGLRTYVVDPARWRVMRYEEHLPTGELVEERVYSDFGLFGEVYLPRRVVFRRPLDETLVSLYYRDLAVNPGRISFPMRVSASAERVLIE